MKIYDCSSISAIKVIEAFDSADVRGGFTKFYHEDDFQAAGIDFGIKEIYYSVSARNVIRGMHFQLPPYDHAKLVHVIAGRVMDAVVDLRKGSDTYGQYVTFILDGKIKQAIYIPRGFAHGFKALEDNTVMQYCVGSVYNKDADSGIRYDSIGLDWGAQEAIVSDRDKSFISLAEFQTPFRV